MIFKCGEYEGYRTGKVLVSPKGDTVPDLRKPARGTGFSLLYYILL
jgi:hypothetical protein